MTYADQYALARDTTFLERVRVAALKACADIMGESSAAQGHALRAAYTQQVLRYPETTISLISELVAAYDPTMTIQSTDQHISDVVAALWNTLSGFDPNA